MDEDHDTPEVPSETEQDGDGSPPINTGAAVAVFVAGLVAIILAIYFGVAQTVAGLFVVIGIPLVLVWFVWNVFLRRLWRVRRIRGVQERRELLEAAMRDKKQQTTKATKGHEG